MTPFQAQGSGFSADFTPHPSCLPPRGRGQYIEQGPKTPRALSGHHRQSHTPAERWPEPGSVTASSCPGVTQHWAVRDRGLWLLLPAPDRAGQVPAYGHGESRVSHSLIQEQQGGCLTCGSGGKRTPKQTPALVEKGPDAAGHIYS